MKIFFYCIIFFLYFSNLFQGYQKWLKDNGGKDRILPGLNLTNEQLFFIAFAQVTIIYPSKA